MSIIIINAYIGMLIFYLCIIIFNVYIGVFIFSTNSKYYKMNIYKQ